jgi:FkbM family methyltransferase
MIYYLFFIYIISDFFERVNFPKWTYLKKGLKLFVPEVIGELVVKTIYGFRLYVNPYLNGGLEKSIYYHGTYERGFIDFLYNNLKKGDVFIDIGSNIGLISIVASDIVTNIGLVCAFEPHPTIFKVLQKNINLNNLENIHCFNYGLGDVNSEMMLYPNIDINNGASSLIKSNSITEGIKVNVRRLDNFIVENKIPNPSFVKIDVEGFEFEVLKGMQSLLNSDNPPILIVEYSIERNVAKNNVDLIDFVLAQGDYELYMFEKGKDRYGALIKVLDYSFLRKHDNIVFLPKKNIK